MQNSKLTGEIVGIHTLQDSTKGVPGLGEKSINICSDIKKLGKLNLGATNNDLNELHWAREKQLELEAEISRIKKHIKETCTNVAIEAHREVTKRLESVTGRSIICNQEMERAFGKRSAALEILNSLLGVDELLKTMSIMLEQTYRDKLDERN